MVGTLFHEKILGKRTIIALGGAESISGVFSVLDRSILSAAGSKKSNSFMSR